MFHSLCCAHTQHVVPTLSYTIDALKMVLHDACMSHAVKMELKEEECDAAPVAERRFLEWFGGGVRFDGAFQGPSENLTRALQWLPNGITRACQGRYERSVLHCNHESNVMTAAASMIACMQ